MPRESVSCRYLDRYRCGCISGNCTNVPSSWWYERILFLTSFVILAFAPDLIVIVKDEKEVPQNAVSIVVDELKVFIPFEELVDIEEERKRLEGEKAKLEAEVLRGEKMLSNPGFINKAPESKVNEEKAKLENYKQMLKTVEERLGSMK